MNLINITCKDCGVILAQLRTPITEQRYPSATMCQPCAAKRMKEKASGK